MAENFYETVALAAFALLGLWWVVVADRRREWAQLAYRRRQAYSVSLYFTLTTLATVGFGDIAAKTSGARVAVMVQMVFDVAVLVGPSRKSFMRDAIGARPPVERDWGTAAAVAAAVLGGAHVVRVHAVAQMVQAVRVAEEIRCRQP